MRGTIDDLLHFVHERVLRFLLLVILNSHTIKLAGCFLSEILDAAPSCLNRESLLLDNLRKGAEWSDS